SRKYCAGRSSTSATGSARSAPVVRSSASISPALVRGLPTPSTRPTPSGRAVGDRPLEPAADDIARDRGAAVTQPAGQRQRYRLLGREVDDEEVRPGQGEGGGPG